MTRRLACCLSLFATITCASGADWPQWLGPSRDGLSAETGLLQAWPEGGPPQVWLSRECGIGYGGPAIAGDRLYIMGSRDGVEQLLCFDTQSGAVRWATDLGQEYENGWGNGPRGTPTIDGDRVYALAAEGALVCVDAASGDEQWRASLTDLGGEIPTWGYSESPLIDGDRLVVTPGKEGAIAAFDKNSGEVLWRTEDLDDVAHYSSVMVARPHGSKQYVQLLVGRLVGVAPETGDVLWQVPWEGRVAVIPTPIIRENRVYVTSGYGIGCMLVEIAQDGEATTVYQNKLMKNHHGGVLLLGDHLYGHSDRVGWLCQEFATGERVWRERSALEKGAIAHADGRFYCLGENTGEVVLIEASTEGWTQHGRFTLDPQTELRKPKGKVWTHPVIAGGRLYLRDQELLFSFDVSAR